MDQWKEFTQLVGARMERSLRQRGFQTDQLTLTIAQNLQALEQFAAKYELQTLLSTRARGTFAAMSTEECERFIEFLRLSIHIGKRSQKTRQQWLEEAISAPNPNVHYLATVANQPDLIEGRARKIFQGMSPRAQRVTVMILMAATEAAERGRALQDRRLKAEVVDRMLEQFTDEDRQNSATRANRPPSE